MLTSHLRAFLIASLVAGSALASLALASLQPPAAPKSPANAAPKAPAPKPINLLCPIMGEEVEGSGVVLEYKGQTIGFCCAGCDVKWTAWTEAKKDAFVAKQKPATSGPSPAAAEILTKLLTGLAGQDADALTALMADNATMVVNASNKGSWTAFKSSGLKATLDTMKSHPPKMTKSDGRKTGGVEIVTASGTCGAASFALSLVIVEQGGVQKIAHAHWTTAKE